ncbi:MAG: cupin domain-containing protein [Deltaproteobacteria bacterium]|nr:cupin domain-containing protein [Candidatus Anaeroferrophillacea bacterium]
MPRTMSNDLRELAIGEKIRRIRQGRKLTIQQLAEKAGLSKGLISQIENEQVSPPIATLLKIAASLQTDISHFFQDSGGQQKVTVIRRDERMVSPRREVAGAANLGYAYEALAYTKNFKHMEPFVVTFEGKPAAEVIRFSHQGEEFVFVLEGDLEFSSDEETVVLHPGDSLYFDSDLLHGFRGVGDGEARALVVVYHR